MLKKIEVKNIIYILICFIYIYVLNNPLANLYVLLGSLLFTFMSIFFMQDLLTKLAYKNKKMYMFILISTFVAFIFESVLNSSDFINDSILKFNILLTIMFITRVMYILSGIIISFYVVDTKQKRYLLIPILFILSGIFLYLEIISSYVPYLYILAIIVYIINNFIKAEEEGAK